MKWEMEIEEIEAVLEKIWDLHDKLSDEIHLISRSHFLNSIKNSSRSVRRKVYGEDSGDEKRKGYVFVKGFSLDDSDSAIQEAKSLNAIRTALENLEDQLEFYHTIHTQQRAERDVAIARLEQSRIVLAMRLAEHHGKKYKVLEEASAFVGNIKTANHFVSPENLYHPTLNPSGAKSAPSDGKRSNILISALSSSFDFAKRALQSDHVRGVFGNAAIFAISMITMLHLNRVATGEHHLRKKEDNFYMTQRKTCRREASSADGRLDQLDVLMARG
ncbi:PREDICTED: plastid division protein PDV1 [Tarenaya hassleriana]|uniref:plastid division protein PDV1 n=1 Tax=Tarenaya hassleriana TaxID=28532 RepID=UPI00053C866D|nr:PREDICTED: plastid division protein PDV1 [Tarenaya hassleriana]